jgi:AraC-like DNA-binding protein
VRLITSDAPLAVLAGELGFSDSATFQRAFKDWTGSPPGLYRRSARDARFTAASAACPVRSDRSHTTRWSHR